MRIDAPIITGSFSLNGDTFNDLGAYTTTGSNTFIGDQSIVGAVSASALTGSISYTNLTGVPTLVSGSDQVVSILSSLNSYTQSNDTTNTTQNSRLTSLEEKTGSLASTGSNTFYGTQTISGTVYIANDLIVQGSSSLQNITASAVSIGTNKVILNTDNPAVRYAGISAIDSGSTGLTGSILWDSTNNNWLYQNPSGSSYVSAKFISGPTSQTLGSEPGLVTNFIQKAVGDDHISSSAIYDDGNIVKIQNVTLTITGSKVGINTSFPTQPLEVSGSILTNDVLRIIKAPSDTVQEGPSIYLNGATGSSFTQLQQGIGRFTIWGFDGSTWGEKLTINHVSSAVGIGITNPASKLHVAGATTLGSSSTNGDVTIISNSSPFLIKGRTSYDRGFLGLSWDINPDSAVIISNNLRLNINATPGVGAGSTALFISASGDVGIGSTIPGARLDVVGGGIRINEPGVSSFTTTYSSGKVQFGMDSGGSDGFYFRSYSGGYADRFVIKSNGKIGINTTSPDNSYQGLTIYGSDPSLRLKTSNASGWTWIEFVNNSGVNNFSMGVNQTTPYFGIKAGAGMDSPNIAMNSAGSVGIGTATPDGKLHIYSSATAGSIRIGGGNGTGNSRIFIEANGNNSYIDSYGDSGYKQLTIAASPLILTGGNVGIGEGASTIARLNVNGSTKMNRSFYNWYQSYWTGNGTYWHMKTNMWGGGSPNGNIQYTMSLFKGYMYSYGNAAYYEGATAFHNWIGTIYQRATSGNLFSNVYTSSDGYIVLVIPSGDGEAGVTIDWHQAYAYPFVSAQVTAAGLHGSTSGKY